MAKLFLLLIFIPALTVAQPTTPSEWKASFAKRKSMAQSSLLKDYPVRHIGPTVQGGRIVDIEVNHSNTKEFYLAIASGGIFKTVNNGITFHPVFDGYDVIGMGDLALSQRNPNVLYAGTGEKNSSRSSYAGSGVYKSVDGGKQWTSCGLEATQHISRVIIHPDKDEIVWVAAMGNLYSHNPDRGVFKTRDGGKTWSKTLFINDSSSVIDLVINPKRPDELYASTWERTRRAWNFKGSGKHSAIYKSIDGGETWSKSMNGFPEGDFVGRIGLQVSPSSPETIYAILDNQREVANKKEVKHELLSVESLAAMSEEAFMKISDAQLDDFLKNHNYPKKYSASALKKDVAARKYTVKDIAAYMGGDANSNLRNTKITGAELYRSDDGGKQWRKVNGYDLDGVFYTYGYYFAEMAVSPRNADQVYIYGVPLLKSTDGGKQWHRIDTLTGVHDIHVDHHVVWIDPNDPSHLLLGNDGGLYQSYDEGANWIHINNMPLGQFYTVNVDMEEPYNVYGGLQDNGVLKGSSKSVPNETKHWKHIFSGDGMFVAPDPRNSMIVYTGYQFGNYWRLELDKHKSTKITPTQEIGEEAYRWNWRTPLILSKHNPDIVYTAANKVFRSLDRGDHWEVISDDLTRKSKRGNVPFHTISSLAESPLRFGLLYAGTDDGALWRTDGGGDWVSVSSSLPTGKWVSSVFPSPHDVNTVFVTLNGYREDDFKTYIYKSTDAGKTWTSIGGNLPLSVANVVIQDPVHPDLLYCGLDNGTYASFDGGKEWHLLENMLNVPAYDMLVHPRENELVVGTHGRSVIIADVKPLQQLKKHGLDKAVLAFAGDAVHHDEQWGKKDFEWEKINHPKVPVRYYVGRGGAPITLEIRNEKNQVIKTWKVSGEKGFHTVHWDLMQNVPADKSKKQVASTGYVSKGVYRLTFIHPSDKSEIELRVE